MYFSYCVLRVQTSLNELAEINSTLSVGMQFHVKEYSTCNHDSCDFLSNSACDRLKAMRALLQWSGNHSVTLLTGNQEEGGKPGHQ